MRDPAELQEIENLGEEEIPEEEMTPEEHGKGGILPLFQTALCVLALLALVFFKATDQETLGKVTRWYREEISREIQLPQWAGGKEEATSAASSQGPEAAITAGLEDGSLRRV